MTKFRSYKGYKLECGIGNPTFLPIEYSCNIYLDKKTNTIYSGDLLSDGWYESGNTDLHIGTIERPHPYYGKPKRITYDEFIEWAIKAQQEF